MGSGDDSRPRRETIPHARIQETAEVPERLRDLLPDRWERVGEVLLLRFPPDLRPHQEAVCRAYASVLGVKAVLDPSGGIGGPWRQPRTELLWGDDTETVHVENGIRYRLDPRQVMWSSGNVDERIRMARTVEEGEVVVDLFAGIGYFALPMAVHGRASRVYACEANPVAHGYLVENIDLNGADAVEPRLGDCRTEAPEGVADRVVLGYLDDTHRFLPTALRALRRGGWVHYHEAVPDARAAELETHLRGAVGRAGLALKALDRRRVKSYAPGVSHWVVDALTVPGGTRRNHWR